MQEDVKKRIKSTTYKVVDITSAIAYNAVIVFFVYGAVARHIFNGYKNEKNKSKKII